MLSIVTYAHEGVGLQYQYQFLLVPMHPTGILIESPQHPLQPIKILLVLVHGKGFDGGA